MLPQSRKPQILRLHNLEQHERSRFSTQFLSSMTELFPKILNSKYLGHTIIKTILPDIYFTYVTICLSKRRLGQEYTYVTMFKEKHYQQEGVLVTKKYRLLIFVLQIIGRNLLPNLLNIIINKLGQSTKENTSSAIFRQLGNSNQIINNIQWLLMMLFMLNITKSPNLIDNSLGISYIYTIFNQNQKAISYKIQGILLLAVFIVKFIRFALKVSQELGVKKNIQINKKGQNYQLNTMKRQQRAQQNQYNGQQICRICYSEINEKSCTKCGHIFCWDCIIRSLQINSQCPVCRTNCFPRQVIQIQNY